MEYYLISAAIGILILAGISIGVWTLIDLVMKLWEKRRG